LLLFTPLLLEGQQYSYVHYDVKDGLPSKRVYSMCQDKDGFMWFTTDNGVCRFDGSEFKTFTTENGLPDNDIINIHCDSKNRVWFIPFKKDIAYYYRGKIFNRLNDPVLARLVLSTTPVKIQEDKEGTIWIFQECGVNYITPSNEFKILYKANYLDGLGCSFADIFANKAGDLKVFYLDNSTKRGSQYSIRKMTSEKQMQTEGHITTGVGMSRNQLYLDENLLVYPHHNGLFSIRKISTGSEISIPMFTSLNTISSYYDTALMFNTGDGVWCYNGDGKLIDRFLNGKTIGRSFIDAEGNKWFTSLDDGVYMLGAEKVRQISFQPPLPGNSEVFAIGKHGNRILAGLNSGIIAVIGPDKKPAYFFKDTMKGKRFDRVLQIENLPGNEIICRSDKGLSVLDNNLNVKHTDHAAYKSLFVHADRIYAGTTQSASLFRVGNRDQIKYFLPERTTAILETNDSIYAGTLNDLILVTPAGDKISLGGQIPALKTKITTINRSGDGVIWVGTYSSGLFALKNNQLLTQISTKNGLTSNNCRTTCVNGNNLWVGTDRGLNKIDLRDNGFRITKFTTADGLPADIINAIFADSGYLYTGTAEGLSWFNENNTPVRTKCNILLEQVTVNGENQELKEGYTFSHRQQNILFQFTAISLKAAGNIIYTYRLKGLDDNWQQTQQQSLNFISLPPGSYAFELYATNKSGVKSRVLSVPFSISTPYWQKDWFKAATLLIIVLLAWLLINRRIQTIRKKEAEKNKVRQQIFELEQKAKRAQMNPHFIFNCISSIQHFVFTNELETCNDYLARFARLIRQTLDNSEKTAIQLSEEIKYLENYLSLEQMRFAGKFTYQISVSPEIHTDFIYLPSMLLQPYVENSIRHGVRNRRDHNGKITIGFSIQENALICRIEDNGVGRKMAETLKGSAHIEYQSKGMSLTSDRINAINHSYGEHTDISIADLTGENGESTGTKILIRFPLSLLDKLK
jgi:Histidine kinase/Y_Y_Y domain/Two component regulator propeller